MLENFSGWNVDTWKQTRTPQVDNFSKELSDFLSDEKINNKEQILNFLISNPDLKTLFEKFLKTANNVQKLKCKKELRNCSTEEEIKSIMVENLPDWYKIWNKDIVENVNISEDLIWDDVLLSATEQSDQDTEQARTDTEQARTDIEQARTDTEQARTYIEQARTDTEQAENMHVKMDSLLKERQSLLKDRLDIDEKTRKEAEKIKKGLPEETKKQLEEKGYDENFINDYILLRVTLNEVKNDSSFDKNVVAQFESKVNELGTLDIILKNIDNSCNIPDTSLDSFSSENISQTRTELFHPEIWNDSLIQIKNQNMESHDYSGIFPEIGDKELIKNYGNFLEWDLKEFCQKYQNDSELKTRIENIKWNMTTEEKILLKNYQTMMSELNRIREETENETKNLVEELTILSQIKWMSMCIWQENWKDFSLNKARDIQNDNWVLTLNWHIDWVDFSVRHDTNKENARLQTKSKLWISDDKNSFMVWLEGQYVDSPFSMPSQEEIFSVIVKEVQSDSNDIKKSDDINNYFEKLQQNVMWRMDKVYSEAKYAQHYIRNKVKREKVVDSSLFILRKIKPDIDLVKPINQANSGRLYDFVKILNFNVENSTDTEKDKLCQCISKIMEISDNYKNNNGVAWFDTVNYPPIIENYLKNQTWLENWNENSKLWLIFDMLGYYNLNSKDTRSNSEWNEWVSSKIIINDLYRDLFEFSEGESSVSVKRTNEDKEKYDKETAYNVLDLNNNDLWPPVNYW